MPEAAWTSLKPWPTSGSASAESSQWGDDVLLAMQTAFGEEGIKAVSLLVNQVDTLRAQLKDVENSAGATAAAQSQYGSYRHSAAKDPGQHDKRREDGHRRRSLACPELCIADG